MLADHLPTSNLASHKHEVNSKPWNICAAFLYLGRAPTRIAERRFRQIFTNRDGLIFPRRQTLATCVARLIPLDVRKHGALVLGDACVAAAQAVTAACIQSERHCGEYPALIGTVGGRKTEIILTTS
jgi:hypothetical protein